ncbi:ATP-binding protein [Kitasatospora sp. NPDC093806]|uniref:ATP-binding protein n=1 Tax=Kitasatospora sp. NPDC093806 TaxID=3155075 RepID=UPI0034343473
MDSTFTALARQTETGRVMADDDVLGVSWPLAPFDGVVGFTRRLVIATLRMWGVELGDRADDVALLVSELLTNAFAHSSGQPVTLGLYASRREHALSLGVLDGSSDHPVLQTADDEAEHGRGLFIVDHLTAGRWTSQATDFGKRVMATLSLPVQPSAAQGQQLCRRIPACHPCPVGSSFVT